jgi:hypothetical protein
MHITPASANHAHFIAHSLVIGEEIPQPLRTGLAGDAGRTRGFGRGGGTACFVKPFFCPESRRFLPKLPPKKLRRSLALALALSPIR